LLVIGGILYFINRAITDYIERLKREDTHEMALTFSASAMRIKAERLRNSRTSEACSARRFDRGGCFQHLLRPLYKGR
jgi:hypothetical protein